MTGIKAIYYREIQNMRTRIWRSIIASMVSPALFMIAFGYGIGRRQVVGGLDYLDFLFAGLLAMSTLNACYGITTDINISRFYFKTFDEYLIAPIPRWHIVVGEMFFGMTKGMINVLIFITYAVIAGLNISINFPFIAVLLVHMMIFSLLGFIVALLVRNHADQSLINTFLITPMTFLSGVFFPVAQAPALLRGIVQVFPITHSVTLMRSLLTGGAVSAYNVAMLCSFLVVFFIAAVFIAGGTQG